MVTTEHHPSLTRKIFAVGQEPVLIGILGSSIVKIRIFCNQKVLLLLETGPNVEDLPIGTGITSVLPPENKDSLKSLKDLYLVGSLVS